MADPYHSESGDPKTERIPSERMPDLWNAVSDPAFETWLEAIDCGGETADAMFESSRIFARGACALERAGAGVLCMVVEENAVSARAMMATRSPSDMLRFQVSLFLLNARRAASRSTFLGTMALQVFEEAAFPLVNRMHRHVQSPQAIAVS